MKLPSNLLECAFMSYLPIGPRNNIVENDLLGWISLPVRIVVYPMLMAMFFPVMVTTALVSAIWTRLVYGTAADVLKHSLSASFKTGATYPCQFVFKKPFTDTARMKTLWLELVAEIGMDPDMCTLVEQSEVPKPFPAESGPIEADHYVDEGWNMFKRAMLTMDNWHAYVMVHNGKPGEPTVVRFFLPGHTFDGTSCFNMAKELIARYYGERNAISVPTTLKPEYARKLADANFLQYLATIPYNVLLNTSDFNWMFLKTMRVFGGPGMSMELCMVNLTEEESSKMIAGLKKRGIKPYAGLIYAAFHAYRHMEGANPYSLTQQASMQSRNYDPDGKTCSIEQFKTDRRYIGDWLIGVLHHFPDGDFSLEDAQRVYEALLENLGTLEGNVMDAALNKAHCPLGGAAIFQFFPFYANKARVMDSIFFNNYGKRSIHPDAELYSYNWGAPFRLGFNSLSVNGKICTCLASSHMSRTKLQKGCKKTYEIFQEFMYFL